ncbi:MAG: hypothetical protein GX622_08730 [Bacteroidales bacterium]|nr:hypothetical protein [Bacteroidales bacterium]
MTVDLVIAGRRIRLCSREDVAIRPDERFRAFEVPSDDRHIMFIDAAPGIFTDADTGMIDTGIPFWTAGAVSDPAAGTESYLAAEADLVVEVEPGAGEIPDGVEKVFDAQMMEEVPGGVRNSGEPFWEVFSGEGVTCARVFLREPERMALLVMPHGEKRWKIFSDTPHGKPDSGSRPGLDAEDTLPGPDVEDTLPGPDATDDQPQDSCGDKPGVNSHTGPIPDRYAPDLSADNSNARTSGITVDPLPWPLDGLLLYFLFSRAGEIMIHGSGVLCGGRGWLFTGRSGSGKTTLARIFDRVGDRVIHDDRLVLRLEDGSWVMHNTPVYRNDEPRSAPLDHLWVIRHGAANVSEPVAGAEAVAMILSNCIQQNWDREVASRLAAAADDLAATVRVSRLSFLPDDTIRDYLMLRETEEKQLAAATVIGMLGEGRTVAVTAGGFSMWPAIRPGDMVVISPHGAGQAAAGQIVALRRDGGFVLHRIIKVMKVSGRKRIVTCGDAAVRADEPAGRETIIGMVLSVTRSGRQLPAPRRRLPRWINRMGAMVAGWVRRRQA